MSDKTGRDADDDTAINLDIDDEETKTQVENPLQTQIDQLRRDYLYLGADFENYKKQAIKERSDLVRYGLERFARDLLEIVDNFERAIAVEPTPENQAVFRDGVTLIHRELQSLLARNGVQEINPLGQNFDPSAHEALTSEESLEYKPGAISRVFKKAYKLHDRMIRPAQVVVAKAPTVDSEKKEPRG